MIAWLLAPLERAVLPDYARKVRRIDGISVMASEDDSEDLFEGIAAAFALLRSLHPKAWRRLERFAWCVYLDHRKFAGAGSWSPHSRRITVSARWAREIPRQWGLPMAATMASLLVHETTHARHTELQIGERLATRLRRETHCVREEMRFARRLGLEPLIARCARALRSPLPDDSYFARLHEEVRQLPWSRPMLWLWDWLIERRRRAQRALPVDWRRLNLPIPEDAPRLPRGGAGARRRRGR